MASLLKPETPSASASVGSSPPGLFDVFYEELLTQLMESGELQEKIPEEFMSLQTDLQRVEYLMQLRPLVRDLKIKSKSNLKSLEKSTKYREEGNKLFQHEQTAQAILCYNKSLSYAPHPTVEEYLHPEPEANERHTQVINHLTISSWAVPVNIDPIYIYLGSYQRRDFEIQQREQQKQQGCRQGE